MRRFFRLAFSSSSSITCVPSSESFSDVATESLSDSEFTSSAIAGSATGMGIGSERPDLVLVDLPLRVLIIVICLPLPLKEELGLCPIK
ncbi:predicted protein [Arabidopsis lyrata subsp. lyrata]|uniref:Predicted protein n=1 Tax=Arabidopsis lyrata subsp. lyrata TaxID=81972 RepID=D7MED9_ARALL|nr:predicted protein [Arabidopsis lyrata subsp. lyrata]